MCGIKLKKFLFSLFLFFVLFAHSFCYAETVLTDEEMEIVLTEIEKSKTLLQEAKQELTTVKSELEIQKQELTNVQNTYEMQKKSYEEQITEIEKKNKTLKTTSVITTTSTTVLLVVLLVIIFI